MFFRPMDADWIRAVWARTNALPNKKTETKDLGQPRPQSRAIESFKSSSPKDRQSRPPLLGPIEKRPILGRSDCVGVSWATPGDTRPTNAASQRMGGALER